MNIYLLDKCETKLWHEVTELYQTTFPEWEQEPVDVIAQNIETGLSFCVVALKDDKLAGAYICDVNQPLKYLLLSYLFVDSNYRGQGIGSKLCQHLKDYQLAHQSIFNWLILETELHNMPFYLKLNFYKIDIDYLSPHYNDEGSTPMSLMVFGKEPLKPLTQKHMNDIIVSLFTHGYGHSHQSNRLKVQLSKTPHTIKLLKE